MTPVACPTAPFLGSRLRALDVTLGETLARVSDATDDEAIHDLRVAIRRLRVLLKLARRIFGRYHTDAVRSAFTVVHRSTGALRDEEVLEETLARVQVDLPPFLGWRKKRVSHQKKLRKAVLVELGGTTLKNARALLAALLTFPANPDDEVDVARFAVRAVERAQKEVQARRAVNTDDAAGLHALRIAHKHVRYAAELLSDALPAELSALAKPSTLFQKRLGEIHDIDMAIETLKATRLAASTRVVVIEALHGRRAERVAKYLDDATRSYAPGV